MLKDLNGLVITGFMGTGKSVVGKELSIELKMEFVDLDEVIEKEMDLRILDIFETMGEDSFREVESIHLKEVLSSPGRVVSTGGGAIISRENRILMGAYGPVICLLASPSEILKRLEDTVDRPLLKGEERKSRISELMDMRAPFYNTSDLVVDTDGKSVVLVVREIIEALGRIS